MLAKCPHDVPWHRVLNAQGKISPRAGLGPRLQRHLLETEGVRFTEDGRVDLQDHLWHPPESWLLQQGLLLAPAEGTVGLDTR
jgi:methylated-DNA-protein-cysteine methyltransferase-like protein